MAHSRERVEQPLVLLETDKLLGMRQFAKASSPGGEGLKRGLEASAAGAAVSRAETSRLLSKIGPPEA